MAVRICPHCKTEISAPDAAARSNDIECPKCATRLEVASGSRTISTLAGLAAGAIAWWLSAVRPATWASSADAVRVPCVRHRFAAGADVYGKICAMRPPFRFPSLRTLQLRRGRHRRASLARNSPGNANLPIGEFKIANREIGVPRFRPHALYEAQSGPSEWTAIPCVYSRYEPLVLIALTPSYYCPLRTPPPYCRSWLGIPPS